MRYSSLNVPNSFEDASELALRYSSPSLSYPSSPPIAFRTISEQPDPSNPLELDILFEETNHISTFRGYEWKEDDNKYYEDSNPEDSEDQDDKYIMETRFDIEISSNSTSLPFTSTLPTTGDQIQSYLDIASVHNTATPFMLKLIVLLEHPEWYQDVLCWNEAGTHFAINTSSTRLRDTILPLYYSHNRMASFARQLNAYDFKRVPKASLSTYFRLDPFGNATYSAYSHKDFVKNNLSAATELKPKMSKARKLKAQSRLEEPTNGRRNGNGKKLQRMEEIEELEDSSSD